MKRSGKVIFYSLLAGFAFFSCTDKNMPVQDEEKPGSSVLSVSETTVSVAQEGGDRFLTVTSTGNFSVDYDADWLSAGQIIGAKENNLKLTVKPNAGRDERTAEVMLKAKNCDDVCVTVVQEGAKSSSCDLLSFSLKASANGLDKDVKFALDQKTDTWSAQYLKWIKRADPEMMTPEFETNGARVLVGSEEIVSGEASVSFSEDFTVVVEAENGNVKEYTVSLNCPQINTELPVLHVRPDELITGKEYYVNTYVELFDKTPGSSGEGWWDSAEKGKIEMRGRGNSTWGLPKKPFRLKFPEKFSPIGLNHAKDKSWVIMSQDMDKSLIRNCIAFEYSRILYNASDNYHHEKALNFTPCMQLVNVYFTGPYYYCDTGQTKVLDGEYFGVYQMSDQMNCKKGRIAVDELVGADGSDPDKISGGYVIETDIHDGNHYSSRGLKMTYKYPDDEDFAQAQYDYITNFINQAESILYGGNFKDPVNGWRKYFDEKTLADFIIIKELAQDMDGYTSTYMYKRRGVDKLFFGPIWDCDKGWDNERRTNGYDPKKNLMIDAGFGMPGISGTDWFERFWQDETFRAFVAQRWSDKKASLLTATDKLLDEIPAEAAKSIDANFTVWRFYYQYSSEAKMPAATYASEIERIRTLTRERADLLDRLFNK